MASNGRQAAEHGEGVESPFVAFIWQRFSYKGGDFVHELIRLPTVQQAGEPPHVTPAKTFTLSFDLHTHKHTHPVMSCTSCLSLSSAR